MAEPLCPKCGCRPRYVILTAKVKAIYADGEAGKIVELCEVEDLQADAEYECGGRHRFTKEESLNADTL